MTQAREEQLISDVAETKALLKQFMETIQPTFATKSDVKAVADDLHDHKENHKEGRNLLPIWAGVAVALAIGVIGVVK